MADSSHFSEEQVKDIKESLEGLRRDVEAFDFNFDVQDLERSLNSLKSSTKKLKDEEAARTWPMISDPSVGNAGKRWSKEMFGCVVCVFLIYGVAMCTSPFSKRCTELASKIKQAEDELSRKASGVEHEKQLSSWPDKDGGVKNLVIQKHMEDQAPTDL